MATVEIMAYKPEWDVARKVGRIKIAAPQESGPWFYEEIEVDSAVEMQMLVDILRNEKPVYFDAQNRQLLTGYEPTGEGE